MNKERIKLYRNTVPNELCQELLGFYNTFYETGITPKETVVTTDVITNDSRWDSLLAELQELASPKIEDYLSFDKNLYHKEMYEFSHAGFTSKKEGEMVPYHYDVEVSKVGGELRVVHYAVLIYLNDDYEGGELIFPHQDVAVKPEVGLMVIFPTSYLYPHLVTPVFENSRYDIRLTYVHKNRFFG